jgi:hypothetical protein
MDEIWKTIPGFPSYQVSNRGRIRTWVKPGIGNNRLRKPRYLRPKSDHKGQIMLVRPTGKSTSRSIKKLVVELFDIKIDELDFTVKCTQCGEPVDCYAVIEFRGRSVCAACLLPYDDDEDRYHKYNLTRSGWCYF